MILFLSILFFRQTYQICVNQSLEDEIDVNLDNVDIWITYQINEYIAKELENMIAQVQTSKFNYSIKAKFAHNKFYFYSSDLREFKPQTITAQQGQYFLINVKLPENEPKIKIKYNIYFDSNIVLRVCSSKNYQIGPVINSYIQDIYRIQERILELDNSKLSFQIWIKEIVPSHFNQQTIHIFQYKDYIQKSDSDVTFTHEFLLKKKKLLFYNQNGRQDFSQNIQQVMRFNYWYLLIFNQFIQENQKYNQELFIYSLFSEHYQLQTNYSYSFYTGIQLLLKNSIFTQFTVIQNLLENLNNFTQFCQPDCVKCENLVCLQCKYNLILQNGMCVCDKFMFTTEEGICRCIQYNYYKDPSQILQLKEIEIKYEESCKLGYYYDSVLKICRDCNSFRDQLYFKCISTQKMNPSLIICKKCGNLKKSSEQIQTIEQCDYGYFLISGQCRKCPINCDVCEMGENKKLICLFCTNSLIINNLCKKCSLQHCELCVEIKNTQECKICEDQYALNELKQCTFQKIEQMEQLKILIQQDFQLTKNIYDENCELFSQDLQECVFCGFGFQNIQQQCLQCEKEFIQQVFDKNNILGQKWYTNIVDSNFKLKPQQSRMSNNQKCYNDTSKRILILDQSSSYINQNYYFNQISENQISYCHININCYNVIDFNVELVSIQRQFYLVHQSKYFKNVNYLLQGIQIYDTYVKEYNINIQNKNNLNMTLNQFKNAFLLQKKLNVLVNLILIVNLTITNDQTNNSAYFNNYRMVQFNGMKFVHKKQFAIQIDVEELILKNLQIQHSLSFMIKNAYYVVFNDSKISNIKQSLNLFHFDCNLRILSSRISIINSIFIESHIFGFYKQLQRGWITDFTLKNITQLRTSRLFYAAYSSNVWCHFENFNFTNIFLNISYQFDFAVEKPQDKMFLRASNFNYNQVKLNLSRLFNFASLIVVNFTIKNLELVEHSRIFSKSFENKLFYFQLYNVTFLYSKIETECHFLWIIGWGGIQIRLFQIKELYVIIKNVHYELNILRGIEIEIKQYLIYNTESQLLLGKHVHLSGDSIVINDYQIRGLPDNSISMEQDLKVAANQILVLQNLIYDNVILADNQLIRVEAEDKNLFLQISILNSYFNIAMMFQNDTQWIDEVKSSIIQVENKRNCQFHLIESQFKVQYIRQNISRVRDKKILYFKGGENLNWNNHVVIKQCLFDITNYDRNMYNYFSLSGTTVKVASVGVQVKERFLQQEVYMKNYSQIFMVYGNKINLHQITVYQIALYSILFKIKDFAVKEDSDIQMSNIEVIKGSAIRRFLDLQTNNNNRASIANISLQCYMIETLFSIELLDQTSLFLVYNFTCDTIYYSNDDFLIRAYGSNSSEIQFVNLNLTGSHKIKKLGRGLVIDAKIGYIFIENCIIQDFLMSALQIEADFIYIEKFKIKNCISENNMITIFEQFYYQLISILKLQITDNIVYNNSLIHVDLSATQIAIFRDWRLVKNQLQQKAIHIKLYNQSHFPQAYLRFVKFKIIENSCDQCVVLESLKPQILKIIESIFINNFCTNLIQLKGMITKIIDSNIINTVNDHRTSLIRSDERLKLSNTFIFSIKSIIFQIPNPYEETSGTGKRFVNKEKFDEENNFVSYKDLDPDVLKLTFTNQNQIHNLKEIEIRNKTIFTINPHVLNDDLIYFPSGQSFKNYRVLIIKSKQYAIMLQNFQIYGFNVNNLLLVSINTCRINILDQDQSQTNNIQVVPQTLNESQTFMDLILVGNPYTNEVFTFEAICNFNNKSLIFQQNFKFFKCQLGEFLHSNKCLKCDIERGYYTVTKRAVKCKSQNQEIIEQLNHGLIKIKKGYWRPHYSNDQIEMCTQNPQNCLGGWEVGHDSCQIGYLGALCQDCDLQNIRGDGYFGKVDSKCYQCNFSFGIIFKLSFFIVFQLFTIAIATRSQYMICQRYQNLIVTNRYYRILNKLSIDQSSVLIKQIQNYFFYIQFISQSIQIDLQVESIVKIVSNPISLSNPHYDCIIKSFGTPELITKILIQLVTPITILILFYSLFLLINRYLKIKFIFTFIFVPLELLFIIYSIGVFQYVIGLITTVNISGIWWIQMQKSIEYYNKSNIPLFILISITILIFIVIIPMIILKILHRRRNQLLEKNWLIKFGYLYQEYQVNIFYWEFIKMGLKVIFITQTMLLLSASDIKYIVTVLLIVFQSEIIKQFQPYYLINLNQYDRKFHLLLLITTLNFILVRLSQDNLHQQIILVALLYIINAIYFLIIIKFMISKYIQINPILFDKLKQIMNKTQSVSDSYQSKRIQTKKRFLMMKRYAKSQLSYKINQQQFTQMQMVMKSNIFSNLSEAINEELIPQLQQNQNLKGSQKNKQNQLINNEIELQSVEPNFKQITIEDLPSSKEVPSSDTN